MRLFFLALAFASLTACGFVGFPGVYKIDIEQGNLVTQEMVDQLKPGMSRRQVRFIMGTPLVEDAFNQDRWDYTYVIRNGLDIIRQATLTVFFDGDQMTHFGGDFAPTPDEEIEVESDPETEAEADAEAEAEAATEEEEA